MAKASKTTVIHGKYNAALFTFRLIIPRKFFKKGLKYFVCYSDSKLIFLRFKNGYCKSNVVTMC